ncbi:carbonic anhydrase [Drosophila sulfurigaster albostrigata]|uniref:Carbonic anhydrase n=1 Tax=Drosophila albomicans TaxID=7291 RepID=A0A6P8WNS4_DROAB|nr:carbonic anhydrase [Drosophila albomicans]XP_060651205.1 carbonic anhydrase [Drosophila nasuta]XP_062126632.1 carbonic anhydrase [Drosophila sulfurigaster albostrigata]
MSHHWGYTEENGPAHWAKDYPQASGHRQSPVDITPSTATKGSDLKVAPLKWKYVPEDTKSLVNPGYCWRVDVNGANSELTGGPLGDQIFKLEQFHCHWGCQDSKGSEHTVDGVSYAGELHLVHWNTTKYKSFGEAAAAPDGLAVLGVFLQPGDHHAELDTVTSLLQFVLHKGDRVTLPQGCDPGKLLPDVHTYWTYEGSLTTPPCSECVIWIVFKTPIQVSDDQLNAMRNLNAYDVKEECPCNEFNGKVINNFRPPLPLGKRELREIGGH